MAITGWIHSAIIVPLGMGRLYLCCTILDCKPGDVNDSGNSNGVQRTEAARINSAVERSGSLLGNAMSC